MQTGRIVLQEPINLQLPPPSRTNLPLELILQNQGGSNETVEINHGQNNSGISNTGSSGCRGNVIIFNTQSNRDVLIPNHGSIIIQTSRYKNPEQGASGSVRSLNKFSNGLQKHTKFFSQVKFEGQRRIKSGKR